MKKISILSLHLGYGGIEKSIVTLANILCERYEVEIATCYKLYEKSAFALDDRVKVKYLNKNLVPNKDAFKSALKNKRPIKLIKEGLSELGVDLNEIFTSNIDKLKKRFPDGFEADKSINR